MLSDEWTSRKACARAQQPMQVLPYSFAVMGAPTGATFCRFSVARLN
jgi:hypothetical protein